MDEWVKAPTSKPDSLDLSLIPGTSMTGGKNNQDCPLTSTVS